MASHHYHGSTAIAAAGASEYKRRSDKSILELAVEACEDTLRNAGLPASEVDGIASYSLYSDSVPCGAVGASLGIRELNYLLDMNSGGQSPSYVVMHAAMAIKMGLAKNVLVFRALKGRSGVRVGQWLAEGGATDFRLPIGVTAYPQQIAMWVRRYMIETGATEDDLAAVVAAQRVHASRNPRAILRDLLPVEEHRKLPYLVEPLRRVDCTIEADGAAAVLVTSLERARDLRLAPAVITGSAWASRDLDLDMGSTFLYPDFSRGIAYDVAEKLWASAGLGPADVDVAQLYDCFSGTVLLNLEGFGFCGRGEAGNFVRSGATAINGKLPLNTGGGLLCEGYLHGMNSITEAVWQLQGQCPGRQVKDPRVAMVSSGVRSSGSALVLTKE